MNDKIKSTIVKSETGCYGVIVFDPEHNDSGSSVAKTLKEHLGLFKILSIILTLLRITPFSINHLENIIRTAQEIRSTKINRDKGL